MKVKDTRIIRNAAQCLKCNDIIESRHRHDWVSCKCGEIFVDGGLAYMRAGATSFKNFKSLSEVEDFIREETDYERTCREAGHPLSYVEYVNDNE
jgi:hypothetical protein